MNKLFRLTECVWEITLACPFSCRYCGSGGGRARKDELSTEECFSVARQLKDLGCRRVSLIGGEVFVRRDWAEIAGHLTNLGLRVNLITNGYLLDRDLIERVRKSGIESVAVSIDGPEEVHDLYRQEGSFRRAVAAVDSLSDAVVPVSVITTLNSENIDHLEDLLTVLNGRKIFAWQLQACSPMGNAALYGVDHRFDFHKAINFVRDNMRDVPFMMGVADNIGYFTPEEGSIRGNMSGKAYFRGCAAGISSIGIDSAGNVRGCESMYDERFIEGNLREKSLREIWEGEDSFSYNRRFVPSMLTGSCAECEMGRYCAGGCRSYNYFVHGKLYESPYCARRI